MEQITVKTPWKDFMGDVPMHLTYFDGSLFEALERIASIYPNYVAFDFMGKPTTYQKLVQQVRHCAACLDAMGIEPNDKITIAMPNCPQAVILFYAVNLVGGIANMIHPLSAEKEITFYLQESESVAVLTLDQFYEKVNDARQGTRAEKLIIASIADALSPVMKIGYKLTKGRKIAPVPADAPVIRWKDFWALGRNPVFHSGQRKGDDPAVILYSGGTTGTTKGIVLTNRNFNALGQQVIAANPMFRPGDKMLAAMPIFHGFGLGVSIHSMLMSGGRCILVPQFTPKSYA
jgi:long-chain acyl-CoA synthetase